MHRLATASTRSQRMRPLPFRVYPVTRRFHFGSPTACYSHKYAHKLQQKAREKGLDLEELKTQACEEDRCKQRNDAAALLASFKKADTGLPHIKTSASPQGAGLSNTRRDGSPIKPLASILNLQKLLATPHTPSQISALWTAYHASRTKGTGRGYICASLPLESYNAMARVAKQYPVFVLPIPRESTRDPSANEIAGPPREFFFMQWDFHPPPSPSATNPNPSEPATSNSSFDLPEPSTVLFTPLQEYKLRTSFATPYLVLTFYTDLTQSHGIVLMRGEITPSSTSAAAQSEKDIPERFLLSQADAQLLAMGLQKFYLWGEGRKDGEKGSTPEVLLKQFHENPEKFSWQDLLTCSNVIT